MSRKSDYLRPPLKPGGKFDAVVLPPLQSDTTVGKRSLHSTENDSSGDFIQKHFGINDEQIKIKKRRRKVERNSEKVFFEGDDRNIFAEGYEEPSYAFESSSSCPNLLNIGHKSSTGNGSMAKLLNKNKRSIEMFRTFDSDKYKLSLPTKKEGILDLPDWTVKSKRIILKEIKSKYVKWKEKDRDVIELNVAECLTNSDMISQENIVEIDDDIEVKSNSNYTLKSSDFNSEFSQVIEDDEELLDNLRIKWQARSRYQMTNDYSDNENSGDNDILTMKAKINNNYFFDDNVRNIDNHNYTDNGVNAEKDNDVIEICNDKDDYKNIDTENEINMNNNNDVNNNTNNDNIYDDSIHTNINQTHINITESHKHTKNNTKNTDFKIRINKNTEDYTTDEYLDIGNNCVMTFRVLEGVGNKMEKLKQKEVNDSIRYRSVLQHRENNLENINDAGNSL